MKFLKSFESIPLNWNSQFIGEIMNKESKFELENLKIKNHISKRLSRAGTLDLPLRLRSNTLTNLEKNIEFLKRSKFNLYYKIYFKE